MFKRITGTRDILPEQTGWWQKIEAISRKVFFLYDYQEIRPPLIEEASLFNRSLGETAEIVQKQMFLIHREDESYALRPEGTASIVRAYVENSLDKSRGFSKFFYMGPMFRMERPQKGRLRQFHHIGCEAIGSRDPEIDIEVITLADSLLKAYGISGYTVVINSLGCPEDRKKLSASLRERLKAVREGLCDDCKLRYEKNILRILDCKNEECRRLVSWPSEAGGCLCTECSAHFDRVKRGLDVLKVNYQVSPTLVRGLDYYTGTVFEFKHPGLGPQQDALGAGGRYDNLVKELGGPDLGAIGFAFGVERLQLASEQTPQAQPKAELSFVIPLGEAARQPAFELLYSLREQGIQADTDYEGRSLKSSLRRANDLGARFALILGEDELKEHSVMVKDLAAGKQEKVPLDKIGVYIKEVRSGS
ncbi:MAG: histidine--tRNA ligase [Deltaproteobacteria bacterium]